MPTLQTIAERYTQLPTDPVRTVAWKELELSGMPKARHEAYSFIPLSVINAASLLANSNTGVANASMASVAPQIQTRDPLSLLALILRSHTKVLDIQTTQWHSSNEYQHWSANIGSGQNWKATWLAAKPREAILQADRLDLHLQKDASAHLELYASDCSGVRLRHLQVDLEAGAHLQMFDLDAGGTLSRLSLTINLLGEGASVELNGLSLLRGSQQSHRHLVIRHVAEKCTSSQKYRHVLTGSAQASLDGTVEVEPGANETNTAQLINSLLLTPGCKASTKPNLRIRHDAVECSHGSTCGDLNADALFYLESRGISPPLAKKLLLRSFVQEILGDMASAELAKNAFELLDRIAEETP